MVEVTEKEKIKAPRWAWNVAIAFIAVGIIISTTSLWWPDEKPKPATRKVAKIISSPQKWQICWQKRPGYRGVSSLRRLCLSAKIETRTKNYIVVSYGNSQTNGVIEATAGGKSTYNGKWKDSGGWGKIYDLHFTSARTAMAWYDEDGRGRKDFSFVLERK